MVPTGSGDDESFDGLLLPDHVGEIEGLARAPRVGCDLHEFDIRHLHVGAVPDGDLRQRPGCAYVDTGHQPRLCLVPVWHDRRLESRSCRREDRGEDTGHRSDPAVETEFTDMDRPGDGTRLDGSARRQTRHGHAQVEPGAMLRKACGREIDGEPSTWQIQTGVLAGIVHALDGFAQ